MEEKYINELDFAVQAVEQNNAVNGGKWSDWEDADHIIDTYCIEYDKDTQLVFTIFLNALIRNDGDGAQHFIDALRILQYGA